jgi:hypothetical protein
MPYTGGNMIFNNPISSPCFLLARRFLLLPAKTSGDTVRNVPSWLPLLFRHFPVSRQFPLGSAQIVSKSLHISQRVMAYFWAFPVYFPLKHRVCHY